VTTVRQDTALDDFFGKKSKSLRPDTRNPAGEPERGQEQVVHIKYAKFIPLSFALFVGCSGGGAGVSVGSLNQADTEVAANSYKQVIGQGWDKTAEVFKAQCVTSNSQPPGGQVSAHGLSDTTLSQDQIEKDIGVDITVKGHYLGVDAQDQAKISEALKQDDYSEAFIFSAEYNTGSLALDYPSKKFIVDPKDLHFQAQCGDEYVEQIQTGAKFYFIQRLDFISREEKIRFDNMAKAAYNGLATSVSIDAALQAVANQFAKSAHVHVEMFQFGGDPAGIGQVLNGVAGASQNGAQAVVDCDLTNLSACKTMRANAIRYTDPSAKGGLADQLHNPQYVANPIKYLTKPWSQLGVVPTPRILTQEITDLRNTLVTKFDALEKWKIRIDRLLYTIGNSGSIAVTSFPLPQAQQDQLKQWQDKLRADLNLVNQAVTQCYDNIDYDTAGKPLSDRVTACRNAVDAVPSESPPAALLTAAGRYEIDDKWAKLGGVNSPLGDYFHQQLCWYNPRTHQYQCQPGMVVDPVAVGQDSIGLMQQFNNGEIFWSPDTDAHAVYGEILKKYSAIGGAGPSGLNFGFPTTDELAAKGDGPAGHPLARYNHFERGSIYWKSGIGAFEVHGGIRDKWFQLGAEWSLVGFPKTDETSCPDNYGRYNHFEGGSIYWTPATGANEVLGAIRDTWAGQGWEKSFYGYPTTDEIWENNGAWRHNDFQHGSIYWNEALASQGQNPIFELKGDIAYKYWAVRPSGILGFPNGQQLTAPDGRGQYAWFQNGSIYWNPNQLQAHEIHGAIVQKWAQMGYEKGGMSWVSNTPIGYPTTDEIQLVDGRGQPGSFEGFDNANIYFSPRSGAHPIAGAFFSEYQRWGWERGACGFPSSDVDFHSVTFGHDYYRQNFENGYMKWYPGNGQYETHCPSDGN
jgi:uncharacterized protein with LGFP repeats